MRPLRPHECDKDLVLGAEAADQMRQIVGQLTQLLAGLGYLSCSHGHSGGGITDIGDIDPQLAGNRCLLFGGTGHLNRHIIDNTDGGTNSFNCITGLIGAADTALHTFTALLHHFIGMLSPLLQLLYGAFDFQR